MITITREAFDTLRQPEQLAGPLFQGEVNAHRFMITGAPAGEVTARFLRPDGRDVSVDGWTEDGSACVVLTAGCYAVSGDFRLNIFASAGGETRCLYACTGRVEPTAGANGGAGDTRPIIEHYPDQAIAELREELAALREAVAGIPIRKGDVDGSAVLGDESCVANTAYSLALGHDCWATAQGTLAVGSEAEANSSNSVAFGLDTEANGPQCAAFGKGTIATKRSSLVIGEYNVEDTTNPNYKTGFLMIAGNGTVLNGTVNRSNAMTLGWTGTMTLSGGLILGHGTAQQASLSPVDLKKLLALIE